MSITRSSWGREQQINRFPAAGGSSGSGSYFTDPEINPHSQVWQTPLRQDEAYRNIAGFREFQQTLEFGLPRDRQAGARKRDPWTFAERSHRCVRCAGAALCSHPA